MIRRIVSRFRGKRSDWAARSADTADPAAYMTSTVADAQQAVAVDSCHNIYNQQHHHQSTQALTIEKENEIDIIHHILAISGTPPHIRLGTSYHPLRDGGELSQSYNPHQTC